MKMAGLPFRLFTLIFCLGLALMAGVFAADDIAVTDTASVSERLENQVPVSAPLVQSLAAGSQYQIAMSTCRSSVHFPAMIVQLSDLDSRFQARDEKGILDVITRGAALAAHIENCNPAHGDVWLRDGMMRLAGGGDKQDVANRLGMSSLLDPNFQPEISARLSLWSYMDKEIITAAADFIDHDLTAVLLNFPPADAKTALKALSPELSARVTPLMSIVPEERQNLLK